MVVLSFYLYQCPVLFLLRPLAYSTLADLVHHVRQSLSYADINLAVVLFSKNIHDETLPVSIQTMSCKLLLNLVECIRNKSEQDPVNVRVSLVVSSLCFSVVHSVCTCHRVLLQGRELFMRMLEVFVLKFKTISEIHLPFLISK